MGCCNCKSKTTRQGSKYCQNCLPHEMQWLVPVSKEPDPFLMDTNHAYITPDNKVWVLSHDRTRAYAVNGDILDNLDISIFALKSDIVKYIAGKGIKISEDHVISTTLDPDNVNKKLTSLTDELQSQGSYIETIKEVVGNLSNKPDKDTVYDDTTVRERITALENKPDKDTTYTAGLNVNISQDNVISVDFQELLTRLQDVDVFNEEQQTAIEELKQATKRIRVYKKGQGINITDDLTIDGWKVAKSSQGTVDTFTFTSPVGEEIVLNYDKRKPSAGEGILLTDDWTISVDLSKVATKDEVNGANTLATEAKNKAIDVERKLDSFVNNFEDQNTTYTAGNNVEITEDNVINAVIPCTTNFIREHTGYGAWLTSDFFYASELPNYAFARAFNADETVGWEKFYGEYGIELNNEGIGGVSFSSLPLANGQSSMEVPLSVDGDKMYFSLNVRKAQGDPKLVLVVSKLNEEDYSYELVKREEFTLTNISQRVSMEFVHPQRTDRESEVRYSILIEGSSKDAIAFDSVSLGHTPCYTTASSSILSMNLLVKEVNRLVSVNVEKSIELEKRIKALEEKVLKNGAETPEGV